MTDRAVPNLPSRDFSATLAFYAQLGFAPRYRADDWMILRRGGVELEFFPAPALDPLASDFMASIRVADLDDLYAQVAAVVPLGTTGYPRRHPIARQHWGARVGWLVDLDGTQLHLIEDAPPG
ncbi:bleomycin resistance protein [Brachybacterium sp. YJGR34]|uniref:bleomycin resistance protein n=1 Tax=Brachybacterium sp. YJGR34 TaxID=2059911 RepID=UPI000E0B737C|nr:bleomycin resistance protein [Brachybacterium sp. YJGR34]